VRQGERETPGGVSDRRGILAAVNVQPRNVDELIRLIEDGCSLKYLFFWGHHPQRDGSVGPGCLSQWWPARFSVDGLTFATAEHYMMWRKAKLFDDQDVAEKILSAGHPHRAKALGRQVRGFDQQEWERHRYDLVVAGSVAKFGQSASLETSRGGWVTRCRE
jgi:predicted NAD-dependent protein-ADP-ribosyltransferase YbiA (DUF1768 family)